MRKILNSFTVENPTREQQTGFLYEDMMVSGALGKFGEVYDYKILPKTEDELKSFIQRKIREEKPKWIISADLSASVLAGIKISTRSMKPITSASAVSTQAQCCH